MELRASERELYEGRPSWRALMSFYVLGIGVAVLVLVIVGLLADSWGPAVGMAVAIAALTLVIGWLRRISTKYLITTQRLRITPRHHQQEGAGDAARAGSEREL